MLTADEHERIRHAYFLEHQMYGAEYVQAIMQLPHATSLKIEAQTALSTLLPHVLTQHEVERDLAHYEYYVANRDSVP